MALLVSFSPFLSLSSSHFVSSTFAITSSPVSRLNIKAIDLRPKSSDRVKKIQPVIANKRDVIIRILPLIANKRDVIVKASSDIDGAASAEGSEPSSNGSGEVLSVEKLPLESKELERLEQKQKMKLAKKIRLRRKRLLRKRRMRKKGRWPPSKMKKLKNV